MIASTSDAWRQRPIREHPRKSGIKGTTAATPTGSVAVQRRGRFQGADKGHEFRVFAQTGELVIPQGASDRIAILIGLAQVVAATLLVTVLAVHLGHKIVETAKVVRGNQLDRNTGGSRALKDGWIELQGALILLGGAI